MRVQYVRHMTRKGGSQMSRTPNPKWLLIGAIVCALIAALAFLLVPAIIILFSVLSVILAVWGVLLWIWKFLT